LPQLDAPGRYTIRLDNAHDSPIMICSRPGEYFMDHPNPGHPDYFATYHIEEEWAKDGQTAPMRFWPRPLHAMTDAFGTCGFALDLVSEPQPDPAAVETFPAAYLDPCTNPRFLSFVLSPH
jgi:hypothetical protein